LASIESINLVVITVSNYPFTEGLTDAVKAYIDLLPEFNGNIVIVHTRVDYAKLHPGDDTQFAESLKEKKNILAQLAGHDSVPHLLIDNAIGTRQVVRDCITQNTLRNLLGMAKLNQPVPIRSLYMNKTEKMRHVDLILRDKYEASIKACLETLGIKDTESTNVIEKIGELSAKIATQEQRLHGIEKDLAFYDKETLELLHEELYQQDLSILNMSEGSKSIFYQENTAHPSPVLFTTELTTSTPNLRISWSCRKLVV
jgi:hypothetical protein